jgi:hypothetical protein
LVDHNDWYRWFAISSPHIYAVPVTVLLVELPKTFDFIIQSDILSRVEMLLVGRYEKKQLS